MITKIIVNFKIEGIHNWPDVGNYVELKEVSFLQYPHRHIFHIKCLKRVNHDDRDIEIIQFKRYIIQYLTTTFFNEKYNCLNFHNMSCEMIAKHLVTQFNLSECEVLEDGENGAIISVDDMNTSIKYITTTT